MEKISIIIPVRNEEKKIARTISILKEVPDVEIIIVDDHSTDRTFELVQAMRTDMENLRILRCCDAGTGNARNAGIMASSGAYLYFADADDIPVPGGIALMRDSFSSASDIVVAGYSEICGRTATVHRCVNRTADGPQLRERISEALLKKDRESLIVGACWNKMFRASLVKKNRILFTDMRRHQDEVFNMMCLDKARGVQFIDSVVYVYRRPVQLWKRYPEGYVDSALRLMRARMDVMAKWNTDDANLMNYISNEFGKCIGSAMLREISATKSRREAVLKIKGLRDVYLEQYKIGALKGLEPEPSIAMVPPLVKYFALKRRL